MMSSIRKRSTNTYKCLAQRVANIGTMAMSCFHAVRARWPGPVRKELQGQPRLVTGAVGQGPAITPAWRYR